MKNFIIECTICGNEESEDLFIDWNENEIFIKCNHCGNEEIIQRKPTFGRKLSFYATRKIYT